MKADCIFVDTWLDDWVAGRLPEHTARRVEQHVRDCARCGQLASIVRDAAGDVDADRPAEDADLVASVLGRTSGSPCARAEELLPSFVDGDEALDAGGREILEAHLSHCEPCSRLLEVLQESRGVLPALAEMQPPPGFLQRVLAVTSRRPQYSPFVTWWMRLLDRPRASLELAYTVSVLLVVLLGNPVAAFHEARDQAVRFAGSVPVSRLTDQLPATEAATGTIGRLLGGLTSVANAITNEIVERWRQARALLDELEASAASAIKWLSTIDLARTLRGGAQPPPSRGEPEPVGR